MARTKSGNKEVTRLTLNGTTYLGHFEDNSTFMACSDNRSMAQYIQERELGELQPMIIGDKSNMLIMPFKPMENLDIARLEGLWKLASEQTLSHVTSQLFGQLLGKSK